MRETRHLGIEWPQRHTLIFEGRVRVDMRHVCPKDVKKLLLKQARSTYWKKWAAKHENEELKEGRWLEPALALMRKKTKEEWTEKHRNVAEELFVEGGAGSRKDYSTLVGQMKASAKRVTKRKAQKSTGSTIAQNGTRSDVRFQKLSEGGSNKREPQRRSGNGKEVL